jgi:hypothetical protein
MGLRMSVNVNCSKRELLKVKQSTGSSSPQSWQCCGRICFQPLCHFTFGPNILERVTHLERHEHIHRDHFGINEGLAFAAGHTDPMVAILDEVRRANLVDLDRGERIPLMPELLNASPAVLEVIDFRTVSPVKVPMTVDRANNVRHADRLQAQVMLTMRLEQFDGGVRQQFAGLTVNDAIKNSVQNVASERLV